jgi:SH3-like domain-containing protein
MGVSMKKIIALAILLAAARSWADDQTMSVQVRSGQLRATPSFLGKIVTPVSYADAVTVRQKQGEWVQVATAAGAAGWIHQSALSTKKIVLKAGSENVETTASGEELALAGKGFNSDVEADFKKKNQYIDFTWIDRMEKIKVGAQEMLSFLDEGGLAQP